MSTYTTIASMKQYAVSCNEIKGGIRFRNLISNPPTGIKNDLVIPAFIEEEQFVKADNTPRIGCQGFLLVPGKK